MDKQTTLIAVVLAVLLAATGGYFLYQHYNKGDASAENNDHKSYVLATEVASLKANDAFKDDADQKSLTNIGDAMAKDKKAVSVLEGMKEVKALLAAEKALKAKTDEQAKAKTAMDDAGKVKITLTKGDLELIQNKGTPAYKENDPVEVSKLVLLDPTKNLAGDNGAKVTAYADAKKAFDAITLDKETKAVTNAGKAVVTVAKGSDLGKYLGYTDEQKPTASDLVAKVNEKNDATLDSLLTFINGHTTDAQVAAIKDAFKDTKSGDDKLDTVDKIKAYIVELKGENDVKVKPDQAYYNTYKGYTELAA